MLYNTVGGVRGAFKKRAVLLAWVLENCESVYRKLFSEDVWGVSPLDQDATRHSKQKQNHVELVFRE